MRRWLAVSVFCGLLVGCASTPAGPATPGASTPAGPATPTPVPTLDIPASSSPASPRSGVPPSAGTPSAAPVPVPVPVPLPGAGTADVHLSRAVLGHLSTVRLARQDGYDRLVLEFTDQVPGYTVGYRPLPVRADASGAEIPLPGATTAVVVTLHPASAHREDTGAPTYTGPATVVAGTARVTQAQAAGDFEAVLNWVVGLRAKTPFRVTVLGGPPRLVIDFQH